jgi:hypothetical protein
MEPPLPPLHPRLPELLEHLELRLIDAIKWNVLLCSEKGDEGNLPTIALKFGTDRRKAESIAYEARVMRDVLPGLEEDMFERLVVPEYLSDGVFEGIHWMTMRYVSGEPLVFKWSELNFKPETLGGKGMDTAVADAAVDVLRDLRLVDINSLPSFVRRFRFDDWLDGFRLKSETLIIQGLFDRRTVDDAVKLFTSANVRRYEGSMFTNGDFYPRNFIMMPDGKVTVTDWVGGVDPWEFVAMYSWLLMWGNPQWQEHYMNLLKTHFPVDIEEMQIGLLVKSFDQVYRWREMPERRCSHISGISLIWTMFADCSANERHTGQA